MACDGMQLSGPALSTQIILSGEESGALEVKTRAPIEFGAFALSQNQQPLLDNVTLRMNPRDTCRGSSKNSLRSGCFSITGSLWRLH